MNDFGRRIRDLFGQESPADDSWCTTTQIANPWSVLFGRRMPESTEHPAGEPGGDTGGAPAQPPATDLREAVEPPARKEGSQW